MNQTVKPAEKDDYVAKITVILMWIALVISITAEKIGENPHHFFRKKKHGLENVSLQHFNGIRNNEDTTGRLTYNS